MEFKGGFKNEPLPGTRPLTVDGDNQIGGGGQGNESIEEWGEATFVGKDGTDLGIEPPQSFLEEMLRSDMPRFIAFIDKGQSYISLIPGGYGDFEHYDLWIILKEKFPNARPIGGGYSDLFDIKFGAKSFIKYLEFDRPNPGVQQKIVEQIKHYLNRP